MVGANNTLTPDHGQFRMAIKQVLLQQYSMVLSYFFALTSFRQARLGCWLLVLFTTIKTCTNIVVPECPSVIEPFVPPGVVAGRRLVQKSMILRHTFQHARCRISHNIGVDLACYCHPGSQEKQAWNCVITHLFLVDVLELP